MTTEKVIQMIASLPEKQEAIFVPTPVFKELVPGTDLVSRHFEEGMYILTSSETYHTLLQSLEEAGVENLFDTAIRLLTKDSILDQTYAGGLAKVHLPTKLASGQQVLAPEYLLAKVPTIREDNIKFLDYLHTDGFYRTYVGVRISDSMLNKLAKTLASSESFLWTDQFRQSHHGGIVRFLERNVLKKESGELGMMWAWTHFPNLAKNEVGFDISVAQEWLRETLKISYRRDLVSKEEVKLLLELGKQFPSILNGVQLIGLRHPVSSANGADPLVIKVVKAHSRMVGVTAETAKSRLGDFDHDLFFGGYGVKTFTLLNALEVIRANASMFELVEKGN